MQSVSDISLGNYLRERRTRLDAEALGYGGTRRRTAGLRREEVAQRAGLSVNWYSWLEQGRGGAPSFATLDRLSHALLLTGPERRHLFLLGLGHFPDESFKPPTEIAPRLRQVLDALAPSPAIVRNTTWDVVAWNRAAIVLDDYDALPVERRNILRLLFLDPEARRVNADWPAVARSIVGIFRADTARAEVSSIVQPLVADLQVRSPDFAVMWRDSKVQGACDGVRRLRHPVAGDLELEFSSFGVDGRPDLTMLVYTAGNAETTDKIKLLTEPR